MRNPERFPRGARVMFIGDSITHNGMFLAHIQEYYRTHFPEDGVKENENKEGVNPYVVQRVKEYIQNAVHEEEYAASLLRLTDALYEGVL